MVQMLESEGAYSVRSTRPRQAAIQLWRRGRNAVEGDSLMTCEVIHFITPYCSFTKAQKLITNIHKPKFSRLFLDLSMVKDDAYYECWAWWYILRWTGSVELRERENGEKMSHRRIISRVNYLKAEVTDSVRHSRRFIDDKITIKMMMMMITTTTW